MESGDVVPGTTVPYFAPKVLAASTVFEQWEHPVPFYTAISCFAAKEEQAAATAPTATISVTLFYK
jgi:hypothetical protein